MLPFDLHVLGMPPAFNLSQDQTLQFKLTSVYYCSTSMQACQKQARSKQDTFRTLRSKAPSQATCFALLINCSPRS